MNKTIFLLTIWLSIVCSASCQEASFAQLYPKECQTAKDFYYQHKTLFEKTAKNIGFKPQMLFAIVAPEIAQYSNWGDKVETYALKVLYVQGGTSYADFSIGYFQMKPSFVELIEQTASLDTGLKTKFDAKLFYKPTESESRAALIDRLITVEWQLTYLSIFCEIVQKRFSNLSFSNFEEQLRFYASAYNCGFQKSEQEINKLSQKALFPKFSQKKFKYSDLSVWFYQEIMK